MGMSLNREIGRIALPAIVTNVTVPLLGLVDTAIAGHMGTEAQGAAFIGAVAVGTMMFNLIYWNFGFLRMGTSGLTAQACGRGDRNAIAAVLCHASTLGLAIGIAVLMLQWPLQWLAMWAIGPGSEVRHLALAYYSVVVWGAPPTLMMMGIKGWMLGMQDSRGPMVISVGVNVLNIVLSIVAVYVLRLGFAGIAFGTVAAEWAGLAFSLWLVLRKHPWLRGCVGGWRKISCFTGAGDFFSVNGHIFVRSFLMMLLTLFFMAVGARSGDMVLAVNSLIMQMFTLFSYFMDGLAFAAEAVVGKSFGSMQAGGGARAAARLIGSVRRIFLWAGALTVIAAVAYGLLPRLIFGLLTGSQAVVEAAMRYRWWGAAIPLAGMAAFVWDGVYIGLTRTMHMLLSVAVAVAAFFMVFAAAWPVMANDGLWLAFVSYLALRGAVLTAVWPRARPK